MASDKRFLAKLELIREMHERKMADYGTGTDPYANVRASQEFGVAPWLGAIIRLNDKVTRIKAFVRNAVLKNEPMRDNFSDIAVYAIIAWILWDEEHGD